MFKSREYKSGTSWCFWRWTFVPTNYITRLHLIKTPWFAICLHWLNHPDPEPYMHDHPVSFLSIVLRGGYDEVRGTPKWAELKHHEWFNWVSSTTAHSIIDVIPGTFTICLMGPKTREWGFHTENGWVHWKEYNKKYV